MVAIKRESIRILIVDDMPDQIIILRTFLMDEGFRLLTDASDGKKALAHLRKNSFHLIICDWNMPVMTGLQLLQEVRRREETTHIPFLMVTGESDSGKVNAAIKCGVSGFVIKPFTHDILIKKVLKILSSVESPAKFMAFRANNGS